ncbi:MAG TPA: PfkB family carbohydrate kinase [Candidatus Nanoarchaeia archaeon]|nr:PfkB family carbohydrate kinase [Candidatus Nanoarchaeia archaeon]
MDTEDYIKKVKQSLDFGRIKSVLDKAAKLNVLVVGDTIIDTYVFVKPKGRAVKDPILSAEFISEENYAGGILAIANHLSGFVSKVKVVTIIGDQRTNLDFIKKSVKGNVAVKTFLKKDSPTIIKKRFIDSHRNNKLFKIEYMNDKPITEELSKEIVDYLDEELPKYDLAIVGDFGHGFINEAIRRKLEEKANFLAVNTQSNSANMGYNYFRLYNNMDFTSMDESELRLPLLRRFEDILEVIKEAKETFKLKKFMVTRGNKGSIFVANGNIFKAPIVTTSVKDTVGAGDALFAITSLVVYLNADNDIVPFVANCAGGIAANIIGNKESVTKEMLLSFMEEKVFGNGS